MKPGEEFYFKICTFCEDKFSNKESPFIYCSRCMPLYEAVKEWNTYNRKKWIKFDDIKKLIRFIKDECIK